MLDLNQNPTDVTPRRSFFRRIAAMSALGLFGFATTTARAEAAESDGPDWPGKLKGRHKQLFDVYDINAGSPLGFTNNFLTPNESATAVLVFRHKGTPYALGSAIWAKYKVGESFQDSRPGNKSARREEPLVPAEARRPGEQSKQRFDRLLARGTVMGVCSVALRGQSRRLAANAGVTAEEALKEWTANLIPGATVIPSGTWGVNRAQEAGCTYCAEADEASGSRELLALVRR